MWFRRHWPSITGEIGVLFTLAIRFCDWVGRADLLINFIHAETPAWLSTTVRFILFAPSWFLFVVIVISLALIFWDGRRNRATTAIHNPTLAEPKMALSGAIKPAIPSNPIKPALEPSKIAADFVPIAALTSTFARPPRHAVKPTDLAYKFSMDKVFSLDRNQKTAFVKFDPKTKNSRADVLLLTIYALRREFGIVTVSLPEANKALLKVFPLNTFQNLLAASQLEVTDEAAALAGSALFGELEIVALTEKGRLEITQSGYSRAEQLAYDLASRAD